MDSLEVELERARALDVAELADAIESIGFDCTRCGGCCKGIETADGDREAHTATVFPDEVRRLQDVTEYDWRDVARPMPYGLEESDDGLTGETFEWALQTNACGDCVFYAEETDEDGDVRGTCSVHDDRPLICQTYPFSIALGGTSQPMGEALDQEGIVRAHECEGLGRNISREAALELAATLKERAIRELQEAIAVKGNYRSVDRDPGDVVVYDSEGPKRPNGDPVEQEQQ